MSDLSALKKVDSKTNLNLKEIHQESPVEDDEDNSLSQSAMEQLLSMDNLEVAVSNVTLR